jgi:serine/threonine-protein kinase HipA
MRSARVYYENRLAGLLREDEEGYHFEYAPAYLKDKKAQPISLLLPLQEAAFHSKVLFPFFDNLIPEGWLLNLAVRNWKLRATDRMGVLLAVGRDCIGAVGVIAEEAEE